MSNRSRAKLPNSRRQRPSRTACSLLSCLVRGSSRSCIRKCSRQVPGSALAAGAAGPAGGAAAPRAWLELLAAGSAGLQLGLLLACLPPRKATEQACCQEWGCGCFWREQLSYALPPACPEARQERHAAGKQLLQLRLRVLPVQLPQAKQHPAAGHQHPRLGPCCQLFSQAEAASQLASS